MTIEKRHIEKYEELRQFFLQNGHCYVPAGKAYADLYEWVGWIKQSRLSLSTDLINELESMGFDWMMYDTSELRWQSHYYQLKLFKEKHGHCRVPNRYKENRTLGNWVARQRQRKSTLQEYQKKRLDEIGFAWKADIIRMKEEKWLNNLNDLKEFKQINGHCRVPLAWKKHPSLGKWVSRHRSNEHNIPAARKKQLDEIGFVWQEEWEMYKANRWWEYFEEVKEYQKKYGHCRLSRNTASVRLSVWVSKQRRNKQQLSSDKINRLNEIGFAWREDIEQAAEDKWYSMYEQLKQFKKERGHCRVSEKSKTNPQLGNWVARLRAYPERIEEDKLELLNQIGFAWTEDIEQDRQQIWMNSYLRLKAFYEKHGHCRVPIDYTNSFSLWVRTQYAYQQNLSPERKALLAEINFHFEGIEQKKQRESFNKKYKQLKAYLKKTGQIHVPITDKAKKLHSWIAYIKTHKYKLSKSQIRRMDDLGFKWSEDIQKEKHEHWMKHYRKLVAHKRKHGHLDVNVKTGGEDLRKWMNYQRDVHWTMDKWKRNLLDDLNFEWSKHKIKKKKEAERAQQWMDNYAKLTAFYNQYGHTNIPYNYEKDMSLRSWAGKQRYLRDKLSSDKVGLLQQLDFSWREKQFPNVIGKTETDELKWTEKYKLLLKYYEEHGDCRVKASHPNKQLFNWVGVQKRFYKKGILLEHRKKKLEALNFVWYGNEKRLNRWGGTWMESYKKLVAFKEEHGHLKIPDTLPYKTLKKWLNVQRQNYGRKKVNPHRMQLLIDLGFKNPSLEEQWMLRYEELKLFINTNGHHRISPSANKKLHGWVHRQKGLYKNNKLLPKRQQLLKAINLF